MNKIALAGAAFDQEWRGGESRLAEELLNFFSKKYYSKVVRLPFRHHKMRTVSKFLSLGVFPPARLYYTYFLKKLKPNVVLSFYDYDFAMLAAANSNGIPYVLTQHIYWGLCPKNDFWNNVLDVPCRLLTFSRRKCRECISKVIYLPVVYPKELFRVFLRRQYRFVAKSSRIIVPSDFMKKVYVSEIPEIRDRIKVIHNGVDTNLFKPSKSKHGQMSVLFAGGHTKAKGFHYFLRLAKAMAIANKNIEFVTFGFGPIHSSKLVKYLGYLSNKEVANAYRRSSLLVFPALWDDPFPQVPLEAMASGTPVLAFSGGGLDEMIENGSTGFLIPRGNFKELVKTFDYLTERPHMLHSMGRSARSLVERKFSLTNMLLEYEKELAKVSSE